MKKIFDSSHLHYYTDEALYNELKAYWEYDAHTPIIVYGTVSKDQKFLENIYSIMGKPMLSYPQVDNYVNAPCRILLDGIKIPQAPEETVFECITQMAKPEDSKRYNSHFLLSAKEIKMLQGIPDNLINPISINDKSYIRDWVYHELNKEEYSKLEKLTSNLKATIEALSNDKKNILNEQQFLLDEVSTLHDNIRTLNFNLKEKESEISIMNKRLDSIKERLKLLGLLDESLLVDTLEDNRIGISLYDIGNSPQKAISYIQAYMNKKGIKYRKQVLEDFYALISSNDLIILAGDSGTGKTNLVKSFAEAIGGKAIIIPVKPNWTSAEDLLGYYNPIEHRFITTPFLDALIEAKKNPNIPYFICLDEMNLARVEYYFADFLSLLEDRGKVATIPLLTNIEGSTIESEVKNFLSIIDKAQELTAKNEELSFIEIMQNEELNEKLHLLCGFKQGDSLLKYHAYLRKLIMTHCQLDQNIEISPNVRFIGAINVDETTHYLSPKVLDRAHVIRFENPLLMDFDVVNSEIENFGDLPLDKPLLLSPTDFIERAPYPNFNPEDSLVRFLVELVKNYLDPLGVEFSYRTIGQACLYRDIIKQYKFENFNDNIIKNNIILHKVLPKFLFDAQKKISDVRTKKDKLEELRVFLNDTFSEASKDEITSIKELDRIILNAVNNDWIVNYWTK